MDKTNARLDRIRKISKKRQFDKHSLKNVVSLRMSDDELLLLNRIKEITSKSASEIMRDAFHFMQRSSN